MTATKPPMVPDAAHEFTEGDFATATERVNVTRDAVLADPDVARMVEDKTAALARRVETLAALRKAAGSLRHS